MPMGCAVEKPFLQILMGVHRQLDSGTLRDKQANQAYVLIIYCGWWRVSLGWACLIQLRLLAMCLRKLVLVEILRGWIQVRQQLLRARWKRHTLCGRGSTKQFGPMVCQGFCTVGWLIPASGKHTKSQVHCIISTWHHPSCHSQWVFDGSHPSFDLFTLCLTHCLSECSIGKKNHYAINEVTTRSTM